MAVFFILLTLNFKPVAEKNLIYKLDHLAFATNDFHKQIQYFEKLGFSPVFVENNATNMPDTKRIMYEFSPNFNFSLLSSEKNAGIEILDYGHVGPVKKQLFFPVFENLPDRFMRKTRAQDLNLDEMTLIEKIWDGNNNMFFYELRTERPDFRFNKIILLTGDLARSISFYIYLRFRILTQQENWAKLQFNSLLHKNPTFLYLVQSDIQPQPVQLDSGTFQKMAFLSNSLEKDKQLLESKGVATTPINPLQANQKQLSIFFAHGPSGELLEFVSLER